MKNTIKLMTFMIAFLAGLSFNGCILDAFDTLIQKVPISADVRLEDSKTTSISNATISLDSSSIFRSYKGKIKKVTFAEATFVTKEVTPATLQANINISLKFGNTVIFTRTYTGIKPNDYIGDANKFKLDLTESEKSTLNKYLNNTSNTYTGSVEVTNVSGFTGTYKLYGHYDIALTMEVNP